MDLSKVNESLENSGLHANQKKAILDLIDQKINNDMKEFTAEIKRLETKIDTQNKTILWVVSIAMAILLAIIALKK